MKKINNYKLIGLLISLVAFVLYVLPILFLWYPQWQESRHLAFNWPDANANFWSVSQIVNNFSIGQFDSLNIPSNFLLHTRSQNVIDGVTLPMTFLPSLFVMSSLAWFFGQFSALLLIPLLAAAIIFIFHLLVRRLLPDEKSAITSTILLATLGPWVYFASQPLLPNIIVIFLALLSLHTFLDKKYLAGSLFFALAIACRPPEIIWLAPLLFLFFYFLRPKVQKLRIINSLIIFGAVMIWALYLNKAVFGGYFLTGYSNFQGNSLPSETSIASNNIFSWFFPFGIDLFLVAKNYLKYFWLLIWPYSIFILLGIGTILASKNNNREKKYLLTYFVISILLVLYYASWDFSDALVKNLNTISISYVRYFLPIFIMSMPLVVMGINYLTKNLKNKYFWQLAILLFLIIFSVNQVVFTKNDGLLAHAQYVQDYYREWQAIKKIAPAGSIIISERSDKYLYPYYRVVVPQGDLALWPRIKDIYGSVDIYYYTSEKSEQLRQVEILMSKYKLQLSEPRTINDNFILYKVSLHLM
ncbi:MAG: hypothetical protein QG603_794 [Patescibacteria group bacterium]|nr:hypothetical protein [Patescibacteria group bacterium]